MEAYTVEELNELLDGNPSEGLQVFRRDKLKGFMIANGHRKQDKPFGMPYTLSGLSCVYFFIDNQTVYGFNSSGLWVNPKITTRLDRGDWQPYSRGKWEIMLLNYAKRRGYKNGNYKCLLQPKPVDVKLETFFIGDDGCVYHGDAENVAYNQVFESKTGVWAEIIEEEPKYTHTEWCDRMKQFKL